MCLEFCFGVYGVFVVGIVIFNVFFVIGVVWFVNIDVVSFVDIIVVRGFVVSGSVGVEFLVEGERRVFVGCVGVVGVFNVIEEVVGRGSFWGRGCGGSCGWEGGDGECVIGVVVVGLDEGG